MSFAVSAAHASSRDHAEGRRPRAPRPHVLVANSVRVFAGAERFALDAALGLAGRGYPVTVQAYPEGPLAARATASSLEVHPVATRTDGAFWQVIPLVRWLARHHVDVVLTNYEKDLRTVGWAAHLSRRPIAVIHSRECDVPLKNRPHYRYFYTRVAGRVLANSAATLQTALRSVSWLSPERCTVLPKGVDVDRFALADPSPWRRRLAPSEGQVLLGFAGQLVPRKRVEHLIRALAEPALRDLPWRLSIAGDGPEQTSLRAAAERLGLRDRVHFAGYVDDLAPWMRAIDVLVLPSKVEGFGYVLVEAAAAGRPTVGYEASSVPEIIQDGGTGLLADPRDERSLGDQMARLITDSDLRARMGRRAQDVARERFDLKTMLDRLESIVETEHLHRKARS